VVAVTIEQARNGRCKVVVSFTPCVRHVPSRFADLELSVVESVDVQPSCVDELGLKAQRWGSQQDGGQDSGRTE
jgi:hypothetical protein